MSSKFLRSIICATFGCVMFCIGTAIEAQIQFATGEDAEISADGLHRIDRSVIVGAWAKPDLDLSAYTRIYYQPAAVAFREVGNAASTVLSTRFDEVFPLTEVRQAQLRELFATTMREAIEELDSYELTDQVGRDVLLVRGSLLDFISGVPPDSAGSSVGTIRWVYEATVLVELRDAMSDEILARTIERQRADGPVDINDVTVLTPRLIRNWTSRLARNVATLSEIAR